VECGKFPREPTDLQESFTVPRKTLKRQIRALHPSCQEECPTHLQKLSTSGVDLVEKILGVFCKVCFCLLYPVLFGPRSVGSAFNSISVQFNLIYFNEFLNMFLSLPRIEFEALRCAGYRERSWDHSRGRAQALNRKGMARRLRPRHVA